MSKLRSSVVVSLAFSAAFAIFGLSAQGETVEQVLARFKLSPLIYVDASVAESMECDENGGVTAWRDLSARGYNLSSYTTQKGKRVRYDGGRYPGTWVYDMGEVGGGIDMRTSTITFKSCVMVMDIAKDGNAFSWGMARKATGSFTVAEMENMRLLSGRRIHGRRLRDGKMA